MLPWIVLLLPLLAAFIIMMVTRPLRQLSAFISVAAVLGSFVGSSILFFQKTTSAPSISWVDLGPIFSVPLGLMLDPLSRSMLMMVTGVGALIHIYSLGYMGDDSGKSRYFAGLSLFMFAMLGIVLANNFVMMFVFWELVGFSSYLLIGHWF
jgi:NADH-quinone oxidoreductase subunit L